MSADKTPTIRLHADDNVVVARDDIPPGAEIPGENIRAAGFIPCGHKIATAPVAAGEALRQYGQIIGFARCPIAPGEHVHSHNLEHDDFARDYAAGSEARDTAYVAEAMRATFMGYRRPGGRVGTRNYIGRLVDMIHWWEDYVARHDGSLDNNPTPGNKAGGLTTILEKSLGAAAKGGTTNLVGVYRYAEPITAKGFTFMDTPGYDPVSITGMVAGGANMLCFTTGRGSVFGCKPVPCLKLATNSAMYHRMSGDMDINCGLVIDGEAGIEAMGEQIFRLVLDPASGAPSKSEALGFGDDEFIPWQIGAVM